MKQGKKPLMVMTITTEIARSWLEVNIHNRPVNDNTIGRYVGNSGKFGTFMVGNCQGRSKIS